MIKYFLTIVFLLSPAFSEAGNSADKMTVYLQWENNVGIKKQKSLHVENRRILVNSRPIDTVLWPKILPNVKNLGQVQATSQKNCGAGTYTLAVTNKAGKKRTEQGCLNSKRFAFLSSQFETLQLNAQLN